MMKRYLMIFSISGLLAVLVFGVAQAKGVPERIEISIPGYYRTIVVDADEQTNLDLLGTAQFTDFTTTVKTPENLGVGFEVVRYFGDGRGYQAFDRVWYFTNTAGEQGYVFYFGIVNGSSDYDARWYRVSEEGEAAFWEILEGRGVSKLYLNELRSRGGEVLEELDKGNAALANPLWVALGVSLVCAVGLGVYLRTRQGG